MNVFVVLVLFTLNSFVPNSFLVIFLELAEDIGIVMGQILAEKREDRCQVWLLILMEFEQIDKLLSPLKSPENHIFSYDFRGNICEI